MQHHLIRSLKITKLSWRCGLIQLQICRNRRHLNTTTFNAMSQEESEQEPSQSTLFCRNDPDEHSTSHLMQIYSIEQSLSKGRLASAMPKHFAHLSKAIHSNSLLIRSPALECIEKMRQAEQEGIPVKILLSGPTGSGKSLSLLHVLHYGMLKNMIILYIPNPYHFVDAKFGTLLQSSWKESRFDQPGVSKVWLDMFRSMNPKFLAETRTTQEYKWGKRDSTPCGKTLLQLLEQGCSRDRYITDTVGILLREIRLNKDANVLFAVDACNGLFSKTSHQSVDPENLALIEMFTKLLQPGFWLKRGAYMFATSRTVPYFKPPPKLDSPSSLETLFDQNSLLRLADFLPIEVPIYSAAEFLTMLNFYNHVGWLARENSDDVVKQVAFLTHRNPHAMQQILRSL